MCKDEVTDGQDDNNPSIMGNTKADASNGVPMAKPSVFTNG